MRHTFRDDVFGGITSAIVMLPMMSAFGAAPGLGPAAGVYGAVAVGFFAAAFGGTPAQISDPTGPMTITMAAVVTLYAHDLTTAFTIVMLAGLIQISMGFLRVGRFVSYAPYSVSSVSRSFSTFPPGISWTVLTRRNDYRGVFFTNAAPPPKLSVHEERTNRRDKMPEALRQGSNRFYAC